MQNKLANQVRIISGSLRGRKVTFPQVSGLRPSGDRIRETLFNWLTPWIGGSDCLDLFAGSGALGIEALSRGAQHVVFVEAAPAAAQSIQQHLITFQVQDRAHVHSKDARQALLHLKQQFDIVFLDPPFSLDLWLSFIEALLRQQLLKPDALIYFETDRADWLTRLPPVLKVWRQDKAGHVIYGLLQWQGNDSSEG